MLRPNVSTCSCRFFHQWHIKIVDSYRRLHVTAVLHIVVFKSGQYLKECSIYLCMHVHFTPISKVIIYQIFNETECISLLFSCQTRHYCAIIALDLEISFFMRLCARSNHNCTLSDFLPLANSFFLVQRNHSSLLCFLFYFFFCIFSSFCMHFAFYFVSNPWHRVIYSILCLS